MKSLPQNLDSEKAVIASALMYPQEMPGQLRPEHFYDLRNERIWQGLLDMVNEGQQIDVTTLALAADNGGWLSDIGGPAYLGDVSEYSTAFPESHAAKVIECWQRRQMIQIARKMESDAFEGPSDASESLGRAADDIITLQATGHARDSVTSLRESLREVAQMIDSRRQGEAPGISTGFPDVDSMLGGMRPGQLIVLAARPRMGKSALALAIAEHVSRTQAVLFVSLEMSHVEQTERLLTATAKVNATELQHGKLGDDDFGRVFESMKAMKNRPLFYMDDEFNAEAIVSKTRALHRKHSLGLVIADYLQLCESAKIPETQRERAVASFSRSFKKLANQLQIPVLALAQLNRDVEKRSDKRPQLSDLRESGAIEQDANVVAFLHRPEIYDEEDRPGVAEFIVSKNRSGRQGIVPLRFVADHVRFETPAPAWQEVAERFI